MIFQAVWLAVNGFWIIGIFARQEETIRDYEGIPKLIANLILLFPGHSVKKVWIKLTLNVHVKGLYVPPFMWLAKSG